MGHATTDVDLDTLDIREFFRDHVFGCFIEDHHGIASIDEIGVDNVMCETACPHSDSTWPNCITAVKKLIGHLSSEAQYKILRGNAEKLYRFTGRAAGSDGRLKGAVGSHRCARRSVIDLWAASGGHQTAAIKLVDREGG